MPRRRRGFASIGIDRPGYGLSTPQPDRTIAGWVPEALTVMDSLDIDQFFTVGVSTGGAYALALAALEPDRVLGVVACCAFDGHAVGSGAGEDERTARARRLGRARS